MRDSGDRFSDKVALVTGAGSGIGRATVEAFSREGAKVALVGRTAAKLEAVAKELPPERALVLPMHHENPEEVKTGLERTISAFGQLDILVNNAGSYTAQTVSETPPETWEEAIAVNLTGPFLLTRSALPLLRRQRNGVIVNIASTLALKPIRGAAPYCVAKAGLVMLTRATALEEAANGVRVNAVCPGVVDTPIHRQRVEIGGDSEALEAFRENMAHFHPLGRIGTAAEIASLVLFLASDASSWTTGAVVTIDGGVSLV